MEVNYPVLDPFFDSELRDFDAIDSSPYRSGRASLEALPSRSSSNSILVRTTRLATPADEPSKPIILLEDIGQHRSNSCGPLMISTSTYLLPKWLEEAPLRDRYELTRLALDNEQSLEQVAGAAPLPFNEYESVWAWARRRSLVSKSERSDGKAWEHAQTHYKDVVLSGQLDFGEKKGQPIFKLSLSPLKTELSCRFYRRFGQDRFMMLKIPGLYKHNMPRHLRDDRDSLTDRIKKWLAETEYQILGRTWRAFDLKEIKSRKKMPQKNDGPAKINQKNFELLLFAEKGCDIQPRGCKLPSIDETALNHSQMTVKELLQWFMPWEFNEDIAYPKAFARTKLGLSQTQPTVTFEPHEMIRCEDYNQTHRPPGRLDVEVSEDKKAMRTEAQCCVDERKRQTVMNDGCGRISREAALGIASHLGATDSIPSAFQGRIGGAKGLWMVDTTDQRLPSSQRNYWIEIYDSQQKFEPHPEDYTSDYDPARTTFEVVATSHPLSSASLNFQLIPILVEGEVTRGIMKETLSDLTRQEIMTRVADLDSAIDRPVALRKWNQDNDDVSKARSRDGGIMMFGSLPLSPAERVNWFLEHAFEPRFCRRFAEILGDVIKDYCERLEHRIKIGVGRSTSAYIGFDHTGCLEQDEIHLCFSNTFRDPQSAFEDNMLHDVDVLVARSPALHPWDIQKRRAVFRPELRGIRDVVVFSSKGDYPLAGVLSGGDYDGDTAWICWDPRIVANFRPQPPPSLSPQSEDAEFGITRERTTLGTILSGPSPTTQFLTLSFGFNLNPTLVGMCTLAHERLCYSLQSISHPSAIALATLCGLLVDSEKQGINFTDARWVSYLRKNNLPTSQPETAYRSHQEPRCKDHILDHILFTVAKPLIRASLAQLTSYIDAAPSSDLSLSELFRREEDDARTAHDSVLLAALRALHPAIERIREYWSSHINPRATNGTAHLVPTVDAAMSQFQAILPPAESTHPLLRRWRADTLRTPHTAAPSHWALLRASAAFYRHSPSRFVWWIAGRELGWLKAAGSGEPCFAVVGPLYHGYKLDGGYVKRLEESGRRTEDISGRQTQEAETEREGDGGAIDFERDLVEVMEGLEGMGVEQGMDGTSEEGGEEVLEDEAFMEAVETLGF